jgi:hypothetical protein
MTRSAKIGLIVTFSVLAIGGIIGYYVWKSGKPENKDDKKTDGDKSTSGDSGAGVVPDPNATTTSQTNTGGTLSNFEQLKKNLGTGFKVTGRGTLIMLFNKSKNQADFYPNGRFVLSRPGATGYDKKGSYTDGGTKLFIDGGKTIEGSSVYTNLFKAIM